MKRQKSKKRLTEQSPGPVLFTTAGTRRRHALILPRYLAEDSQDKRLLGSRFDRAFEIMKRWADLEKQGHLARKETALDASFLHEVFGEGLGYRTSTQSPEKYELERNFTVEGVGTADGALGDFAANVPASGP